MRLLLPAMALIGMSIILTCPVLADDSQPLQVKIIEIERNTYQQTITLPSNIQRANTPRVQWPLACSEARARGAAQGQALQQGNALRSLTRCTQDPGGQTLSIQYPHFNPALATLLIFERQNGERHTAILDPQIDSWQVPNPETRSQVAKDYTRLGIHHIWAGADHLLFLLCLLWIAKGWRRVVLTISGFTVAHSITLGLSALSLIKLPLPPVEATIALSVVFLATEIAKSRRDSLTWRYPVAVSSTFGLLHGLGFAAVLNEIGLPQTELLTGLLFFNVGVEIGQLVFAAGVLVLMRGVKGVLGYFAIDLGLVNGLKVAVVYLIGGVSAYWLVERSVAFVPGL